MPPGRHPCQFSPEVLIELEALIGPGEHIHDPFAGPGLRLAALCDRLGATFSGTDIEDWPDHDPRVGLADARDRDSYPPAPFTIVTSPVYLNKRCADYADGPTPKTKIEGRRDYGIALGRRLHPDNLARATGRPSRAGTYWQGHREAMAHWGARRVLLNVDQPISGDWAALVDLCGYQIERTIAVKTRRYRGLHNAEVRAECEILFVASHTHQSPAPARNSE